MKSILTAINGTINEGVLTTENPLSLFPDGTAVIVIDKSDFVHIAGSDSTRYQLQQAREEIERLKGLLPSGEGTE